MTEGVEVREVEPDPGSLAELEARARRLAMPLEDTPPEPDSAVLTFTRCGALYAVDAERVAEVARLRDMVALPGVPPAVAGVVVHDGRAVAVVDPGRLYGGARQAGHPALVVVLEVPGASLALCADALSAPARGPDSLAAPPATTGLATQLDVDALAADARVVVDHQPE